MDAEAFEMLSHSISVSPSYLVPGEESAVELPSLDDLGQLPARIDSIEAEESGVAVIDHFPFGSAGAPIPSPHEDATWNGPSFIAPEDSIWAPFCSQCDWEFGHWAKIRGTTSSAIMDLLAIPEVCAHCVHLSWR
jgi:hypothetical protein